MAVGPGASDDRVWAACRESGRALVTRDRGFSIRVVRSRSSVPAVLLLRLRPETEEAVARQLESLLRSHPGPWTDFVASVSEGGYRIRRR